MIPFGTDGASQSIEGAFDLFNLLKENNNDTYNIYFRRRSERAKLIKKRSNFNFFAFHISNPAIQAIRNMILKILVKRKTFMNSYLGKVYKN